MSSSFRGSASVKAVEAPSSPCASRRNISGGENLCAVQQSGKGVETKAVLWCCQIELALAGVLPVS
jgi:hypothetical protein